MPDRHVCFCLTFFTALLTSCSFTTPIQRSSPVSPSPISDPNKKLEYHLYKLPRSIVHTVKIPVQSQYVVTVAIANKLQTVEDFATSSQAIVGLNGGFFDPENQRSTSVVFQAKQLVARPEDNTRLMSNPNLLPYLDKILNRTEFRRYQCDGIWQYDITQRQALPPPTCQLQDAIGGGPQLLPFSTSKEEGFSDVQDGKVIRDALGQNQANARSAIGFTRDGSILFVLSAQRTDISGSSGLSLPELTNVMKQLGVEKAMNLDGGSSASLYFQGEAFYGKVNEVGDPIVRQVKSAILVHNKKPEDEALVKK